MSTDPILDAVRDILQVTATSWQSPCPQEPLALMPMLMPMQPAVPKPAPVPLPRPPVPPGWPAEHPAWPRTPASHPRPSPPRRQKGHHDPAQHAPFSGRAR